ncbi:stevor PIR protein, putative [Plasmodium reichenowi]|uniref:Stevor PIR protein, putative n=1 Tax=Plasmodium reichenowi TaxID=5854 RepID=A0A2P9DTA7_PLARE|nr:stevor PIR protein, putative [Plasmodium reichenowi]
MNTYYVKLLLFTFLINNLVLPYYENCEISHYNVSLITKNAQGTTIKSRLLAQTQNHNPHYHNDPELKEIIDKLNKEAIKKYQQTHDPYKQLKEVVENNATKLTGRNGTEPMSTIEKELLETYEDLFGEENHIMLKSGRYPNDNDESDDSASCGCTDINNAKLATTKGRDKYLKHLKQRCTRAIFLCSYGSFLLTWIGLVAARVAAAAAFKTTVAGVSYSTYASYVNILNMFYGPSMTSSMKAAGVTIVSGISDLAGNAAAAAATAINPYAIAIYVLIAITVLLIILYIWLYKRRKRSLKHECKKYLCK